MGPADSSAEIARPHGRRDLGVDRTVRVVEPDGDAEVRQSCRPGSGQVVAEPAVAFQRSCGGGQDRDEVSGVAHLGARAREVRLGPALHAGAGHEVSDERDRAVGGLVPVEADEVRRYPGRPADLGAEVEGGQARHRGHRSTAGRAAGRAGEVPGIVGGPEQRVVGLHVLVARRHVRLAHDDRSGPAQPGDRLRVLGREVVCEVRAAAGRPHALGLEAVLGRDRQPVQRAEFGSARPQPVGVVGLGPGAVGVEGDDRVQRGVEPGDPVEVVLDELPARDLALVEAGQ